MLKIEGLKKQYNGFSLDCSLEVEKGQITELVMPMFVLSTISCQVLFLCLALSKYLQ